MRWWSDSAVVGSGTLALCPLRGAGGSSSHNSRVTPDEGPGSARGLHGDDHRLRLAVAQDPQAGVDALRLEVDRVGRLGVGLHGDQGPFPEWGREDDDLAEM